MVRSSLTRDDDLLDGGDFVRGCVRDFVRGPIYKVSSKNHAALTATFV